jgi:4-amino-4-deoxy-L-arabinose transferase-like glycosyltransferase
VIPVPTAASANYQITSNKYFACLFSIGLVFIWVAWTTFWDAGLYGDNVEQFVWVHSLEWGYHKHPPMPTWLLGAAMQFVGPHSWLTNALAAVCFAITGWLTWLIARDLLDEKLANTAIILWTLQQCFSLSAQIYNHNTILVMFMAATVYAALRARAGTTQHWWWLSAGIFAGCAMLSKYQAALPLFVLFVAVCITNTQSLRSLAGGLATATAGFSIVFSPHLYWAVTNNFPTLRYASAAIESGGTAQRLAWVATFFINQIRMVLPLLLAVGLSFAAYKTRRRPALQKPDKSLEIGQVHTWMWGLVWAPVVLLVITSVITGSQLRNHWGVQLFQFLPIWVAWYWRSSYALKLCSLIPVALAVHAIGFGYYALKQSDPNAMQAERRADSAYPARRMADEALAHWKNQTRCPLKIVQGDFEAGLVSAFTQGFPVVYSDPVATPWVKPEHLKKYGALYVLDMNTPLPSGAMASKKWFLKSEANAGGKYVQFAVRLPSESCG